MYTSCGLCVTVFALPQICSLILVHFLRTVCCEICTFPADCMLLYLYTSCGLYFVIFVHFLWTVCCDIRTLPADCTLYTSCWLCVLVFALSQEYCSLIFVHFLRVGCQISQRYRSIGNVDPDLKIDILTTGLLIVKVTSLSSLHVPFLIVMLMSLSCLLLTFSSSSSW